MTFPALLLAITVLPWAIPLTLVTILYLTGGRP